MFKQQNEKKHDLSDLYQLLISWDFHAQSLGFTQNGEKNNINKKKVYM